MTKHKKLNIAEKIKFKLELKGSSITIIGVIVDFKETEDGEIEYYFVKTYDNPQSECEYVNRMFIVYPDDIIPTPSKTNMDIDVLLTEFDKLKNTVDDLKKRVKILELSKNDIPVIPYMPTPPAQPIGPYWDPNYGKVWCETETHNYTASIPPEEWHKYRETYSNSTDADFNYKNYAETPNTRMESTMFGNEVLDDKYDTWGLTAAYKKINNNNQNKK